MVGDIDTSGAYMLFYEREGLCHNQYMPNVSGRIPVDVKDLDQDFDSDLKKVCTMMWLWSLNFIYFIIQERGHLKVFLHMLYLLLVK